MRLYGVPRGGIPVVYLLMSLAPKMFSISDTAEDAHVIIDDIVDSGRTKRRYVEKYPQKPFHALCDFLEMGHRQGRWVVFPWEVSEQGADSSADDIVVRLLQKIGENPNRGGLIETPKRVLKAWEEWTSGYGQDPRVHLKCFEDGAERYDQMVAVKDLPFYSHCEHHLAAFFGTATIAYLPDKKVVGLSKLGRVLRIFSRRLQVQERLTCQIADALHECLEPRGVGVLLRARHLCMESRGLSTQGHHTETCALRGLFLEDKVKSEFLALAR